MTPFNVRFIRDRRRRWFAAFVVVADAKTRLGNRFAAIDPGARNAFTVYFSATRRFVSYGLSSDSDDMLGTLRGADRLQVRLPAAAARCIFYFFLTK
jgi:hypothetical protein